MSSQSEANVSPITRHPRYYFPDGSVVLQAGEVLFKIQRSLLIQECEAFRDMFAFPTAQTLPDEPSENHNANKKGTNDEDPIFIPEITPVSFENFLSMFYNRPSDPEFLEMMTDTTTTTENHTLRYFHVYFDIADLSHRFVAPKLEAWALKQLKGSLKSPLKLCLGRPILAYQLGALNYARVIQDKSLERKIRTFVKLSHFYLVSNTLAESAVERRRRMLIEMFQHPSLRKDQPSLFGFVLCIVLSLGHEFWLHQPSLTREDRIMLMSSHILLTPLPFSELDLEWIENTLTRTRPRGTEGGPQSCVQCNFQPIWERVFLGKYLKELRERQDPSGGVRSLSTLVLKRASFADALPDSSQNCKGSCKDIFIEFVDEKIERVFALLADFYKDFE